MPNIRPISQKFKEMLRFENFEKTRFSLTLTHINEIQASSFGSSSHFIRSINLLQQLNDQFRKCLFLLGGGQGRKFEFILCQDIYFDTQEKFQYNKQSRLGVITNMIDYWGRVDFMHQINPMHIKKAMAVFLIFWKGKKH